MILTAVLREQLRAGGFSGWTRADLPAMLTALGYRGLGAEVGTRFGEYAMVLLNGWPGTLILVDIWKHLDGYEDMHNAPDEVQEKVHAWCVEHQKPYGARSIIRREMSDVYPRLNPAPHLDFVYIDADHSLEGIRRDIKNWAPLVRAGGVVSGHDYSMADVKTAVDEWCAAEGLKVNVATEDWASWMVLKPDEAA